jgi:hypothetical protein
MNAYAALDAEYDRALTETHRRQEVACDIEELTDEIAAVLCNEKLCWSKKMKRIGEIAGDISDITGRENDECIAPEA